MKVSGKESIKLERKAINPYLGPSSHTKDTLPGEGTPLIRKRQVIVMGDSIIRTAWFVRSTS